jgi:pre-mRNA-splicing factor ATP-dependent RNA helicase DHX15/PRP43
MKNNNYDTIGILDPEGINNNPLTGKPYSESYKSLANKWSKYPTYINREEIIDNIKSNDIDVILIISGTGSGKTVLIPKFALHALDYKGNIALTFPKRMIAYSSAQFAAVTLDVELGKEVGYMYKDAPKNSYSENTKMLYMTDGSLTSIINKDPLLSKFDIVIIDEAHERKTQIDLLLLLIKKIIPLRKENNLNPLKLIIMSATIDPHSFINYFKKDNIRITKMEISGQPNYPIESIYTNDIVTDYVKEGINIIQKIMKNVKPGPYGIECKGRHDILFFVTSGQEAINVCEKLKESKNSSGSQQKNNVCIEIYADMPEQQKEALKLKEADNNMIKIYIATNAAESSITLDGIKYVIDSGYELFSSYDPLKMARTLNRKYITKAQALQRKGRVGRTEPGTCYHLYTEQQFNSFQEFPLPDILKADLSSEFVKLLNYVDSDNKSNILDKNNNYYSKKIKTINNSSTFNKLLLLLSQLMDPPTVDTVNSIYRVFKTMNIIDKQDNITKLGRNINKFSSLSLTSAISLMLSYELYCAYDMSLLIALVDYFDADINNIFANKNENNNDKINFEKIKGLIDKSGDHLTLLKIFKKFDNQEDNDKKIKFCKKYNLNIKKFLHGNIKKKSGKLFRKVSEIFKEDKVVSDSALSRTTKKEIDTVSIIKCLAIGNQTNIAKYSNKKYHTIYPITQTNVKFNKNSVYSRLINTKPKICIFDELFIMNGVAEIKFITKISSDIIKNI